MLLKYLYDFFHWIHFPHFWTSHRVRKQRMLNFGLKTVKVFPQIAFLRNPFLIQKFLFLPPKILVDFVKSIPFLWPSLCFHKQTCLKFILLFRVVILNWLFFFILLFFCHGFFLLRFNFLQFVIIFQFWQDFKLFIFAFIPRFQWGHLGNGLIHMEVIPHEKQIKRHLFLEFGHVFVNGWSFVKDLFKLRFLSPWFSDSLGHVHLPRSKSFFFRNHVNGFVLNVEIFLVHNNFLKLFALEFESDWIVQVEFNFLWLVLEFLFVIHVKDLLILIFLDNLGHWVQKCICFGNDSKITLLMKLVHVPFYFEHQRNFQIKVNFPVFAP